MPETKKQLYAAQNFSTCGHKLSLSGHKLVYKLSLVGIEVVTKCSSHQVVSKNHLKGAHPCTSSSEQGGGKRVLEAFF